MGQPGRGWGKEWGWAWFRLWASTPARAEDRWMRWRYRVARQQPSRVLARQLSCTEGEMREDTGMSAARACWMAS